MSGSRRDLAKDLGGAVPAPVQGAVAFELHPLLAGQPLQDSGEETILAPRAMQAVQDKLPDGGIADHTGVPQHGEVPGDGRLGKVEDGLKVGHEEWGGRQAVHDPEPGRLGDGEEQRARAGGRHIRVNEYIPRGVRRNRGRLACIPESGSGIFPRTVMNRPSSFTVFVNERAVQVPPGADARTAVRALEAGLADRLAAGAALLTDARGLPIDPAAPLFPGAILRVVISARRAAEADAHP